MYNIYYYTKRLCIAYLPGLTELVAYTHGCTQWHAFESIPGTRRRRSTSSPRTACCGQFSKAGIATKRSRHCRWRWCR